MAGEISFKLVTRSGRVLASAGISPNRIVGGNGTDLPVAFDVGQFHDYRMEGTPGSGFTVFVDNVLLEPTWADTRDAGNPDGGAPLFTPRGAGYNDIYVSVSMKPGDDPNGHTLIRHWRNTKSRYPVGGIKEPSDGVLTVHDSDLVEACGVSQTGP